VGYNFVADIIHLAIVAS